MENQSAKNTQLNTTQVHEHTHTHTHTLKYIQILKNF